MPVSNKIYSMFMLMLSVLIIFYMLFMLIIVPILPLDESNVLSSISQTPILLCAGISGLLFCGSLSIFTIFVMGRGKFKDCWQFAKVKIK